MKNDQLLNLLLQLQKQTTIPYTTVPQSVRGEFQHFGILKGCFSIERIGRGKCFKVENQLILKNEINRLSPDIDLDSVSFRAKNLALRNDTKAGQTTLKYSYFQCKAIGNGIKVENENGCLDVSSITEMLGSFSLAICDDTEGYKIHSNLMLIENQQLLDDISWIPQEWNGIILYYGGNIHGRLLKWIKKSSFESIIIFPDYDSVGISNFSRLKKEIPTAKWFWLMNWEHLLKKYGKADLWGEPKLFSTFNNLLDDFKTNGFPDSQLKLLMTKMKEYGKGLEQECAVFNVIEENQ